MELTLSRNPLQKNPNCAYCGKVFNQKGTHLQLKLKDKVLDLPLCSSCWEIVPLFEADVHEEEGFIRLKR